MSWLLLFCGLAAQELMKFVEKDGVVYLENDQRDADPAQGIGREFVAVEGFDPFDRALVDAAQRFAWRKTVRASTAA